MVGHTAIYNISRQPQAKSRCVTRFQRYMILQCINCWGVQQAKVKYNNLVGHIVATKKEAVKKFIEHYRAVLADNGCRGVGIGVVGGADSDPRSVENIKSSEDGNNGEGDGIFIEGGHDEKVETSSMHADRRKGPPRPPIRWN